jgi:hypothetical protein
MGEQWNLLVVCTGLCFDEGQEDGDWMEADWMLEYVKREAETLVKG